MLLFIVIGVVLLVFLNAGLKSWTKLIDRTTAGLNRFSKSLEDRNRRK